MNASLSAGRDTSREQPFECDVCHSRFTRYENLKRHAALHTRPKGDTSPACRICRITFSRRDLRDRHMKRKHPEQERNQSRNASISRRNTTTFVGQTGTPHPPRSQDGRPSAATLVEEQNDTQALHWDSNATFGDINELWDANTAFDFAQLEGNYDSHMYLHADQGTHPATGNMEACVGDIAQAVSVTSHGPQIGPSALSNDMHISDHSRHHRQPTTYGPFASPSPSSVSSSDSAVYSQSLPDGLSTKDLPYLRTEWYPSPSQVAHGLGLHFLNVSHFVPFLHQPTFESAHAPSYLILSMLSIAYHHGEDPDASSQIGSGERLALHCFHRARVLSAAEDEAEDDLAHNLSLVQSLLLLEICAMTYICGKVSQHGLKMHARMISIARTAGLMRAVPFATANTKDLDSMWREAIKAESHKRTILAAHQIDALWYQFLSVPRSLSHLEIKHELPAPETCWNASTAADWAHKRLVASFNSAQISYTEAVRLYLSRSPEVDSIPDFDPYGAINIAQFLLSSARELSGWSTMTGQVSLERFEPIRASLVALEPVLRPQNQASITSHAAICNATWEMAMLELNIWSPSHTCGIVSSTLDDMLHHSTQLAQSTPTPFGTDVAAALQPHLDWFLQYLDATQDGSEAPWLALYAYKAFLLAWQLVRAGVPGAMQIVNVDQGDVIGAVAWARKVFERRRRRRLGDLIFTYLDMLDK